MTTIPTIATEHFSGFKNLNEGHKDTDQATLQQFLEAIKTDVISIEAYINGLKDPKDSVRVCTSALLASYVASGSGSTKVLTASANGALTIDGVTMAVGDRVLVSDEGTVTGVDRGIYVVTAIGSASAKWVLTRASDTNSSDEVTSGLIVPVSQGTVNASKLFMLVTSDPITLDTTSLSFKRINTFEENNIYYVDATKGNDLSDGSSKNPFATLQKAFDTVAALPATGNIFNRIKLLSDLAITEPVTYIGDNRFYLYSDMRTRSRVRITNSIGKCLIVTNATQLSLDAYIISGTFTDLVNDGGGCEGCIIENVSFISPSGIVELEMLGVMGDSTATTTLFMKSISLENVYGSVTGGNAGIYLRNCGYIYLNDNESLSVTALGCTAVLAKNGILGNVNISYDNTDVLGVHSYPYFGDSFYNVRVYQTFTYDVVMSTTKVLELQNCSIATTSSFAGNSTLRISNTYVGSTLVASETSILEFSGVFVKGNVTFDTGVTGSVFGSFFKGTLTASNGTGVITMIDSNVVGLISDPSGTKRLAHSKGNVRSGRVTAVGAGDQVVAFGTALPTVDYIITITNEDNGAGIGTYFVKSGTRAVGGFTITVSAAGIYHWKAELLG